MQMCFLAFSHQYKHNFSFQSHRLLSSHALAELRGENMPERKVAKDLMNLIPIKKTHTHTDTSCQQLLYELKH